MKKKSSTRVHLGLAALALSIVGTLAVILACGAEQPAAPAPAAGAPASAACAKDTDCKGDRICQAGNCVSPR